MLFTKFSRLGAALATATLLFCFAHGASANGDLFGTKYCQDQNKKTVSLVMGGIGSKFMLKPAFSVGNGNNTGLTPVEIVSQNIDGNTDAQDWLSFVYYGKYNVGVDSLMVLIMADPDTSDRMGYIALKTQRNQSDYYNDTIYVFQPGVKCIEPKQANTGSEFFVSFIENYAPSTTDPTTLYLYATTDFDNTTVTVKRSDGTTVGTPTVLNKNQVKAVYTQSGTSETIMRATPAYNYQYQIVDTKSFTVTANNPISLYAYNSQRATAEMACILPTAALDDEYFSAVYPGHYGAPQEEVLVVATQDGTLVTITPSDKTYGTNGTTDVKQALEPFTISLKKGQTYLMRSRNATGSENFVKPGLTGTHIKANNPIAVFGGNKCTNVGNAQVGNTDPECTSGACDHLFEQMMPLRTWGKKYAAVQTNVSSNLYLVVAAYDNTKVKITSLNKTDSMTLNRGRYAIRRQVTANSPYAYIEADKPVQVALLGESAGCISPPKQTGIGDPFVVILGAADKGISKATFSPVKIIYGTESHYITIVTETAHKNETVLKHSTTGYSDDIPLGFTDMPNTPYSYAIATVLYNTNFNYQLSNPYGFTAYAYGFGSYESYGFLLGAQLGERIEEESRDIPVNSSYSPCLNTTPETLPACLSGSTDTNSCPDPEDKLYWYTNIAEWNSDAPMDNPPVITTARDTAYELYVSKMGRCGILYPQKISVEVLPLPTVTFPDRTVCKSAGATDYGGRPLGDVLSGTSGSYTYALSYPPHLAGQQFRHDTATLTAPEQRNGSGDREVVYMYTNERGCVNRDTATVTVEVLDRGPRLEEFGDSSFCYGEETTLHVANAPNRTFKWYHSDLNGDNRTLIPRATGANYHVMPDSSGYKTEAFLSKNKDGGYVKFYVEVTNQRGCSTTLSDTIHIVPYPPKPTLLAHPVAAGCTPFTYTLSDDDSRITDADVGQWFKASFDLVNNKIPGQTGESYKVYNDTVTGRYTYVYGVANEVPGRADTGKWCWTTDVTKIEVYPKAFVPQISHNRTSNKADTVPVCEGDTITLTATVAKDDNEYTWQWYEIYKDDRRAEYSTEKSIKVTSGRYEVKSISKYGCESAARSKPITLIVREKPGTPLINFTGPEHVCVGDTVQLSAWAAQPTGSDPVTYQWYAVAENNAYGAIGAATNPTYGVIQTGRYVARAGVTYPGDNPKLACYSPYSSVKPVELWNRPLAPNVAGESNVCLTTENIELRATPQGSVQVASYGWYKNNVRISSVNDSVYKATEGKAGAITYKVEAVSPNGCVSDSAKKVVTIHEPKMVEIKGAQDTCYGLAVKLTAVASEPNCTFQWYESDNITGESSATYWVRGVGSSTNTYRYSAQAINKFNCVSEKSAEVFVTIHSVTAGLNFTIPTVCRGDTLRLTVTGLSSNNYDWYRDSSGTRTFLKNTGATNSYAIAPTDANYGSHKYVVEVATENGCVARGSKEALVSRAPDRPTITPIATDVCAGDSTIFTAYTSEANPRYEWFLVGNSPYATFKKESAISEVNVKEVGLYTVKVKGETGCWSPESVGTYLTVHSRPGIPIIQPATNIQVCRSSIPTFSVSPPILPSGQSMSYQWYYVQGNQHLPISKATLKDYKPEGSNNYAVRPILTKLVNGDTLACASSGYSDPRSVTIYEPPRAPTIIGATDTCAGDTITLTAVPVSNEPPISAYRWYKGATLSTLSATDTLKVYEVGDTVSYTVVAITNNSGVICESPPSGVKRVSIRQPTVKIAEPLQYSVCDGSGPILLSATATGSGITYSWHKNGTLLSGNSSNYNVTSTGAYHVTVTDNIGCPSNVSNTVNITVNPNPAAPTVTSPLTACEGVPATLTASPSGQGTYSWYFKGTFKAKSGDTSYSVQVSEATTGSYEVEITNSFGCTSPRVGGEVTMFNPPSAPVLSANSSNGDSAHICVGDSVTLKATNGVTYDWYEGLTINGVHGDNITVSLPMTYTVWSRSKEGCRSRTSDAMTVVQHLRPGMPVISPAGPIRACALEHIPISAYSPTASSYLWYTVENGIFKDITGAREAEYKVSKNGSGSYAVRAELLHKGSNYQLTCTEMSDPSQVTVLPLPQQPIIRGKVVNGVEKTEGCEGDTIALIAETGDPNADTYQWSKNGKVVPFSSSDTFRTTLVETATYTVSSISQDNCQSEASYPKEVTIQKRPSVSIAPPDRTAICYSDNPVTLEATSTTSDLNSGRFAWYKDDEQNPMPGITTQRYTVTKPSTPFSPSETHSYSLVLTDNAGCVSPRSNSRTLTIHPLPPTPTVTRAPDTVVCEGGEVTLTANPAGAGSYQWYFDKNGEHVSVKASSSDPIFRLSNISAAAAGPYSVTITNEPGCTSTAAGEVLVHAAPEAPILMASGAQSDFVHICTGDSAQLSAFSADGKKYEWYVGSGKLDNVTGNQLWANMPITYSVWSINEHGCKSRTSGATIIEIHSRPITPVVQPEGLIRICANGATPIRVFSSGNVSYQWYSVDTATNNRSLIGGATGEQFNVSQSGHYAVCVNQLHDVSGSQSLACATYSDPKAVALFPLPLEPLLKGDPTPTGGERVKGCEGDVLKLTASMPADSKAQVVKYRWYKDNVEQLSVFDSTFTITSVEEVFYKVKAISDNECESVASSPKKIAILPLPHVEIADGTRDTCGKSITLRATPAPVGALYDWYRNDTLFLQGSTAASYVVQPNSNLTVGTENSYNLYVTDKDGCRSSSPSPTVKVNIRALPPIPIVEAVPKQGVCLGSDATLKVDQLNEGMYKWYKRVNRVLDSIGMISDADFSIREAQLTDAGQYAVEIINTHGCKSAKMGEVNLTVLALPEVRILGEQVCEDWTEKDIVNFATPANGTFRCNFGCEDGKFSPLLASQGTAGSVSLTYTFTATNGCENSQEKTIDIVNRPNTPIVIAEGETRVCADSVVVNLRADVSDESAAHYTYRWSRERAVLPKEDSSFYTATKAGDYTVSICNKSLCWSKYESDPIRIEVKLLPTAPVIAAENAAFYCPGEATKLLAHSEASGSFLWYKGDNREMSEIPGEITENYSAREVGQYAVKLFGENECWSPFSNFITVGEYPMPKQPEIIASQTTLYAGLDYKLLVKSPQTDETYEWYKSNLSIDASGVTVPISNLNGDDTGRYTVRVTDQHGCVVESEAYELGWSETDLFIPNVFTPNGDGINDNFQILGLDRFVEHKLQIMNKQRVVIFTKKDYRNDWNGSGYPNDVYYYILELKHQDGGKKTVYGYVHLKR